LSLREIEIGQDVFEVAVGFDDLRLERREIELTLGYTDGEIPVHFAGMIDEAVRQLPRRCEIRAGYRLLDVERPPGRYDGLNVGGEFFRMDKIVTSQLKKATAAALFVCTIGPSMETWARHLLKGGDPALGYIADVSASVAAEAVTNILHDHIGERMLSRGLRITNRYSPGYCNWSVSEQHVLFSLLPENFCGVGLSESALMSPIKSVSGVIGVGPDVEWKDYICDRCGMKDCTYRSTRTAAAEKRS
jgi:Vitamin B12 dependent methionine synthase, activation domain